MAGGPARRTVLGLAAAALAGGTAGCGEETSAIRKQAREGEEKGYIAGDGQIEILAPARRAGPVTLTGTLLNGTPWALSSQRGRVVLLNVWGSWCPPGQTELPHLQDAWAKYQAAGKPVQFIGLLQKDSVASARSTLAKFKITYPSLRDDGGRSLLNLQGKVVTVPTTLVFDRDGRIAARVSGGSTAATFRGLVDQILAERPPRAR